ncbi:MAG: hypothetical protein Q7U98_06615 [Methylicorpusculum sp.]|uniref:hypothetical protein n=1 Tax=Methylicorpusculum sp. TaxID=2713644 RepID=UPI0027161276|nr:hypothetical protein [Methylicorpusculum sp.]MDO8938813.1 hypothetical protein [Methylicorpusculum sp.]MDP2201520.1 hypothetical protein [Methylicorpusculum sp.]
MEINPGSTLFSATILNTQPLKTMSPRPALKIPAARLMNNGEVKCMLRRRYLKNMKFLGQEPIKSSGKHASSDNTKQAVMGLLIRRLIALFPFEDIAL